MGFKYLASPYSHPNPDVQYERYTYARNAVAHLLLKRVWTYSPIVHCHTIAAVHELPGDAAFWWEYNRAMLAASSGLIILRIEGWESSVGVAQELDYAKSINLPWSYL